MELPDVLVRDLNEIGFALTDVGTVYSFRRVAIGSEVYLTVEPLEAGAWRVGVQWRSTDYWGRVPSPIVRLPLARLGRSSDGMTIDLSTTELLGDLPRLMEESVLPMVDLAPG